MIRLRHLAGSVAIAAMLAGAATPAMARGPGWGGGWNGGHHHGRHRGDGIGAGGILAGILVLGGIAAVASSAEKNRQARDNGPPPEPYPDDTYPDDTYPDGAYPDGAGPDRSGPDDAAPDDSGPDGAYRAPGRIENEDAAVDACAIAAEEEGGRDGQTAQVRDVDRVDAVTDGWDIAGVVELRRGYRDTSRQTERFTCTVRTGQIRDVRIEGAALS